MKFYTALEPTIAGADLAKCNPCLAENR